MLKEQELALVDQYYGTEDDSPVVKAVAQKASDTFAKAAYWFALAAPTHMQALYEHGVSLIHGYQGEADAIKGEAAIATAAEAGVVNAMALLGYFYLVGSESFKPDLAQAKHFLQLAAEGEQTEAMANLGVLYYQTKDLPQAYHFISKAAQAGYPHAQYHLALMLANGDGCQRDPIASEYWMAEAAEQGQLDAMLTRAQHMLNDESGLGGDVSQAERYLREVIKYGSAALLNLARRHANSKEAEIIEPLWQSLVLQIDTVLKITQDPGEIHTLNRAKDLLSA